MRSRFFFFFFAFSSLEKRTACECSPPRDAMNLREYRGSTNVKLWLGLLIVPCWPCWVVARGQTRFRLPFVVLTQCRRSEMTYRLPSVMPENQGSFSPQIEMTFWLLWSDAWSNYVCLEKCSICIYVYRATVISSYFILFHILFYLQIYKNRSILCGIINVDLCL